MSGTTNAPSLEQTLAVNEPDVVYVSYRYRGRAIVETRPGREQLTLERGLEQANHRPSGFDWGYRGNGPAQLALALLLDYTDDEDVALAEYMTFKTAVVSQLDCTGPDDCWRLTGSEIDAVLHDASDEPVAPST